MEFLNNIFTSQEENTTPSLEFSIPESVFSRLSLETQAQRLELWVEMLDIQTGSEAFTQVLKGIILDNLQIGLQESSGTLRDFDFSDMEFRSSIMREAVDSFYKSAPTEFLFVSQIIPAVIINGISINIGNFLEGHNTDRIRSEYFQIISNDINNYGEIRYDSDLERNYLASQIGELGSTDSYLDLFQILREYGFMNNSEYLRQVRHFYESGYIGYEQFVSLERSEGINHFDVLQENGFSPALRGFLISELYPSLFEGQVCTEEALTNLRQLCLFIMDIESAGGTNLINGVSTATSYTQTLNEVDSSREDRRYNSLDTRIRYASRFYNEANFEMPLHLQEILDNPDVTQQDRRDVRIVMRDIMQNPGNITNPQGEWVNNMWEYNESGRNMIEFSFDDEMRILLLFLMEKEADSLRDILNGNNLSHAAETLYAAHHSNAYGHTATNRVMNNALERYYG